MTELKRCPFCGSNALAAEVDYLVVKENSWERRQCFYECHNCGCQGPKLNFKNDAKIGWNTRYEETDS